MVVRKGRQGRRKDAEIIMPLVCIHEEGNAEEIQEIQWIRRNLPSRIVIRCPQVSKTISHSSRDVKKKRYADA